MWNFNSLIQIELGRNIIKAANSPDSRNIFQIMFGVEPEDDAKLIIEGIGFIRKKLSKNGIILPPIHIIDNDNINPNEFICYWGLEIRYYAINNLNELFNFIENTATKYNIANGSKKDIIHLSEQSLHYIINDDYQYAYDNYLKAYYHSILNNFEYEIIRSMSEISAILSHSGQIDFSITILEQAAILCSNPNIVDNVLKEQVYLNLANILKFRNQIEKAYNYYYLCANSAYYSSNSHFLFFALLGMAECHCMCKNYNEAISIYELSESLVVNNDSPNYKIAYSIQKEMISLYKQIINNKSNGNTSQVNSFFTQALVKIATNIAISLAETAIFKLFNIKGGSVVLFSLGNKYKFKETIFNSPAIIGDKGKQFFNN